MKSTGELLKSTHPEVVGNDDCEPITKERFYKMIAELNKEPLFKGYLDRCKPTKDAIRRKSTNSNGSQPNSH